MTRVWLSEWEWACCRDAFSVVDRVDFGIASRASDDWLREMLGMGPVGFAGTQPSRLLTVSEPFPCSAALVPVVGVRFPRDEPEHSLAEIDEEPPVEHHTRRSYGWIVEIEEKIRN